MATNKKTMTKQEILKQIKLEEQKIKDAEDRKSSFVFEPNNQVTVVKTKTTNNKSNVSKKKSTSSNAKKASNTKTSNKKEEEITWTYVSPLADKNEDSSTKSNEASSVNSETKASEEVGKLFYTLTIVCGLLLIALIVIVMIGISSNWTFWI